MGREADPEESYDPTYRQFDSPVMRQVRAQAYGEDIGQHSWVLAEDLRQDMSRLQLSSSTPLLDLGCGPCGPLAFIISTMRCHGTGIELSAAALDAGRARAAALGIGDLLELRELDLNNPLPFANASFAAAMSFDVILHLSDRTATFREVARLLSAGGRFLFTDAAVLTGSMSSEQARLRSAHGFTQFTAPGFNQRCLEQSGLRILETEDRTASVLRNAIGRLHARVAHRQELERAEGAGYFEREQQYLQTVIALAEARALARIMYLAEVPP